MWMEIMARDGMNCQSKVTHSDTNTKKQNLTVICKMLYLPRMTGTSKFITVFVSDWTFGNSSTQTAHQVLLQTITITA